jgi:hypothetical protein
MSNVLSDLLEAFRFTGDAAGMIQTASSSLRLELLNGFLFIVGVYALIVFLPFLIQTLRTERNVVADAVFLHLIGHTMFRGWTWLSWHSINEGWDIRWMSYFPVWECSSVIIGISIIWLSNILVRGTIAKGRNWNGWRGWALPLSVTIIGALVLRAI